MESNDWNDAETRVERAAELFEQRRWLEAAHELRAATAINPYNAAWFFNLGLTLDQLGRPTEAIDAYKKSLSIEPSDVQALLRLGADLHEVGQLPQAIVAFEAVQEIDRTAEASYCGRILSYAELGEHEKAEEMFYLARLYKENCPDCFYNIATSLAARSMWDRAIFCWQKTLDLEPDYPQAHLRIAEALWRKGETESARQHYLQALRESPGDTNALLDLARLLEETGRRGEAGEKIRRAIELRPNDPAGHFMLGRWLLSHDIDSVAAEAPLRHAIALDPTFPSAHLHLAKLFIRRGNLAEARRQLRAEILLRPDDSQTLMDLSNLLIDLDETRSAAACLKRLVQMQPDHSHAWQNLAVAQFLRGRFDEALFSSERALQIDPNNIAAIHNLAMGLGQMRRFDDAIAMTLHGMSILATDISLRRLLLRLRANRLIDRAKKIAPRWMSRFRK